MYRKNPVSSFFRRNSAPVSMALLLFAGLSFVYTWLDTSRSFVDLIFFPEYAFSRPWTWVTYTVANRDFFAVLFVMFALYFFAMPMERRWGSAKLGLILLGWTLLLPLSMVMAELLLSKGQPVYSLAVPAACIVVAWGTAYPNQQVLLWGILPILGKWIALIAGLGVVFAYGVNDPVVGVFGGLAPLSAWAVASGKLRIPQPRVRPKRAEGDYRGFDLDKRMQTELERRRLKELFERSMAEDPEEDGPEEKNR